MNSHQNISSILSNDTLPYILQMLEKKHSLVAHTICYQSNFVPSNYRNFYHIQTLGLQHKFGSYIRLDKELQAREFVKALNCFIEKFNPYDYCSASSTPELAQVSQVQYDKSEFIDFMTSVLALSSSQWLGALEETEKIRKEKEILQHQLPSVTGQHLERYTFKL